MSRANGKRHGERGAISVVAVEAIITDDNDLIIAGTTGTLISWAPHDWIPIAKRDHRDAAKLPTNIHPAQNPAHRYVLVAWDAHMCSDIPETLIDGVEDATLDGASTFVGRDWLIAAVHVDSIKIATTEGNR